MLLLTGPKSSHRVLVYSYGHGPTLCYKYQLQVNDTNSEREVNNIQSAACDSPSWDMMFHNHHLFVSSTLISRCCFLIWQLSPSCPRPVLLSSFTLISLRFLSTVSIHRPPLFSLFFTQQTLPCHVPTSVSALLFVLRATEAEAGRQSGEASRWISWLEGR